MKTTTTKFTITGKTVLGLLFIALFLMWFMK